MTAAKTEACSTSTAICIAGPTASGKSALALALCACWPGRFEIVSVDSAQVYRGMDVGTAKPDAATRSRVCHHLLDLVDPAEKYSAARFVNDARAAIAEIRSRECQPLLVGGTMLYFRALMTGLSPLPKANAELRGRLSAEAEREGWAAMHARLATIDPASAARIHPNDTQRIQRALEIHQLTGAAPSRLYQQRQATPALADWLAFAVVPQARSALHARIEARFKRMLESGFLDEVRTLHQRKDLHLDLPAMRAVGYRQLWEYLDGDGDWAQACERVCAATRQYAKRQYTWLRSEPAFETLPQDDPLGAILHRIDGLGGTW